MRAAIAVLALSACAGLSPLRGRAIVGRDAYVIFVADGPGGYAGLFAVRADGGSVVQITFASVIESAPALSPDGGTVAFLRGRTPRDSLPATLWILNLLSGAERELPLPGGAPPDRVGWSADGKLLYVRAGSGRYVLHAPPAAAAARPVADAEHAVADSSFVVLLGDPPFGRVVPCDDALCVQTDSGAPSRFAEHAHDAVRWGADSVGFFSGEDLIVRPLGPGRPRRVEWSGVPGRPREMTVFLGRSER
ncbi:MAG TPA: hypothetical protein VIE46_06015 [Gemmatimonadales bacterium]